MADVFGGPVQVSSNQGSEFQEYDDNCELFRQRFRQFQYKEAAAGPRQVFNKLHELCHQWLKPQMRSKEQMLELLVLEQFLMILPWELETWVTEQCPETTESVVSLLEQLERELETPEPQNDRQEVLMEDPSADGMADIAPDIHPEALPLQAMDPDPEVLVAEVWIPPAGLQELSYGAAGESQPFLESECPSPNPDPIETWTKELQDCMEMEQHSPSFDFMIGENPLLDPSLLEDLEQPNNQLGYPSEQLAREDTLLVLDGSTFKEERAETPSQEEPVSPRALEQNNVQRNPHECTQCGKYFASRKVLNGHLKIHLGVLPHGCLHCGKRFLRKSNLLRHIQVHAKVAPYKCSACERQFSLLSHFIEHQRTASDQGAHTCPECRERFCNRRGFVKHLKIHTNGRPYKCHLCGKTFGRQRDLNVHHLTHTAERPFMCEYCGNRYRHKSSLAFHLRNHVE